MSSPRGLSALKARLEDPVAVGLVLAGLVACLSYGAVLMSAPEPAESSEQYTVVVTGEASVDGRVAGSLGDAVLTLPRSGLTEALVADVQLLGPTRLLVLGGPAVISPQDAAALSTAASAPVTRLAGRDRYETAARAAVATFPAPVTEVVVTTTDLPPVADGAPGEDDEPPRGRCGPSERLCGAVWPVAGAEGVPVLLVLPDHVPAATARALRTLRPGAVSVVGGVSAAVMAELQAFTSGEVSREPAA